MTFTLLATLWLADTLLICGPKPEQKCLVYVEQCLTQIYQDGLDADAAFEWCEGKAQSFDPDMLHFIRN
jgi:hypothetical protein